MEILEKERETVMKPYNPVYKEIRNIKQPDGTIERRESDDYYIRWTDAKGKQRKKRAAPKYDQARKIYLKKLEEVAAEKAGLPTCNFKDIHLEDLLRKYLTSRKPHITLKHFKSIKSTLENIFAEMKVWRLGDVTREKVESYLNGREKSEVSGRTVNNDLGFLKALFNWAVKFEEIPSNPIACVSSRPQFKKKRNRRVLTENEIHHMISSVEIGWFKIAALMVLYCGLRTSDIRHLLWSDVDLEADEINIRPESAKNRKGASLPVHPALRQALMEWRQVSPPGPGAFVVSLPHKPVVYLKKVLKKAGIPYKDSSDRYIDWHSLRHTFLTHLDRTGAGVKTLQSLGRHSDPQLTFGTYIHGSKEREKQAISMLPDYTLGSKEDFKETKRKGTNDDAISAEQAQKKNPNTQPFDTKQDTSDRPMILNQRVPGSSPGGGTRKITCTGMQGDDKTCTGAFFFYINAMRNRLAEIDRIPVRLSL